MQADAAPPRTPWYRREWRLWPLGWQMASLGGSIGAVAFVLGRGPLPLLGTLSSGGTEASTQAVTSQVEPTVAALQVLWRVVFEPFVPVIGAVVIVMVVACVAIGLTLNYVVLGRTWKR